MQLLILLSMVLLYIYVFNVPPPQSVSIFNTFAGWASHILKCILKLILWQIYARQMNKFSYHNTIYI